MEIHQIQVRYEPLADRLLLQIRTRDERLFALWLTRRMTLRLHPHLVHTVATMAVSRSAPASTVVPEARDMLAAAAREQALRNADFQTAFDASAAQPALGPEPMLPTAIDIMQGERPGLSLRVRDAHGRSLDLHLGEEFATAFLQLIGQALAQADWGVATAGTAALNEAQPSAPRLLN